MSVIARARVGLLAVAVILLSLLNGVSAAASDIFDGPWVLTPGVTTNGATPATWDLDVRGLTQAQAATVASQVSSRVYGSERPWLDQPLTIRTDFAEPVQLAMRVRGASLHGTTAVVEGSALASAGVLAWPASSSSHTLDVLYVVAIPPGDQHVSVGIDPSTPRGVLVVQEYWFVSDPSELPTAVASEPLLAEPMVLRPGVVTPNQAPSTWSLDLSGVAPEPAAEAAALLSNRLYGSNSGVLHQTLALSTNFSQPRYLAIRAVMTSLRATSVNVLRSSSSGGESATLSWPETTVSKVMDHFYTVPLPAGPQTVTLGVDAATPRGTFIVDEYWFLDDLDDLPASALRAPVNDQAALTSGGPWRSALYGPDWQPIDNGGTPDEIGRFLHDFSYAGYHGGADPLPASLPTPVVDVTQPPYDADPTGAADATAAIQAAIDDLPIAGGTVYLPAGTYRVAPPPGSEAAITLARSGVVLAGAGSALTKIFNASPDMRTKYVIRIASPTSDWFEPEVGTTVELAADHLLPTTTLAVADAEVFAPGDEVVVRSPMTAALSAELDMGNLWDSDLPPGTEDGDFFGHKGPAFPRTVLGVDPVANTIEIDTPTRFPLLTRDGAEVYRIAPSLTEVGIQALGIGMQQSTLAGLGDGDYTVPGTAGYQVHRSAMIRVQNVRDGWITDVSTYRPPGNTGDWHIVSNGISLLRSRQITIQNVEIHRPQYKGGGGNGYPLLVQGADNLIQQSVLSEGRHNFTIASMYTSGNVFHALTLRQSAPAFASDLHRHLSMANLFDSITLDGDTLESRYRPYGTVEHGHASSQSVFWNTMVVSSTSGMAVESRQFGNGYVVGTSGVAPGAQTIYDPVRAGSLAAFVPDWREGIGTGALLTPASLYQSQVESRLGP